MRMRSNRRGDMSMQTIVVAAIILIIAALLIYLVGKNIGLFGEGIGSCTSRGGSCEDRCSGGKQPYSLGNTECRKDGGSGVCCISGDTFSDDR